MCGLQFDKRISADLDIDQRWLPRLVDDPECLRKSQGPGIVSNCLLKVGNADPHVIQANDPEVLVLGNSDLNGQSHQNPRDE